MRTISYKLCDLNKARLAIGYVGENEHTQVRIDCAEIFAEYPQAEATMVILPPAGSAYPKTVTTDGATVIWTVTDSDLAAEGEGELQLTFTENSVVVKSVVSRYRVTRSIIGSGDVPDPVQDWVNNANDLLADLEEKRDTDYWKGDKGDPGQDGAPGRDGQDGHTPVKGTDYWTAEDKAEIVSDVEGDIIDDTAGDGDTGKTWSADKLHDEFASVSTAITKLTPAATNADIGKALIVKTVEDGKPSSYEYGEAGGGSVDPSEIASAVSTWCNNNITEDPTVVIDKSLSVDGAAADSKAVGDEIKDITGNEKIAYTADGKWIDLSGSTANPSSPSSHNSYRYALVSCVPGDKFTITAKGSSSARAWGFIDSSNNILSVETSSNSSNGITKKLVTAPTGSAYLIINDKYFGVSYKGNLVSNKIGGLPDDTAATLTALETQAANLEKYTKYYEPYTGWDDPDITYENGSIQSANGGNQSTTNYQRTMYIPVNVGDKFDYYLYGNANTCAVVYGYDSNKNAVANSGVAGTSGVYSIGTYTVPSGVAYIRFCSKKDHVGTFCSQTGLKQKTYSTGIVEDIQNEITKHPFISVFFDNFNQSNTDWVDANSAWTFDYTNRTVTSTAAGSVLGSNALVLNKKYIADMRTMSFRIKFGSNTVLDIGFRNADGTYDGSNKITIDTANHRIKLYGYYNSTSQTYPLLIEKDISGFTISTDRWYMVKVERNRLDAIISITDHITGESVELVYTFTDGFFFDELYTFALVSGGNVVIADFDVSIMDRPYIYVVGDSITAYACAVGGWVQKFNNDLDNRLVVSGRGSDTASSIATLFDTEVKYIKPEILMCCHGHNGGISSTVISNLKTMCDGIGCKLYINHITCQSEDRQIERNAVIEAAGCRGARFDIATARDGIPYVVPGDSAIRADPSLYKDTNVHPNMAGYQKMYDRLRIDVPELFKQ